jgi:hypothetical protein
MDVLEGSKVKSPWIGAFAAIAALGSFVILIGCQSNHSQSTTTTTAAPSIDQLATQSAVERTIFTDLLSDSSPSTDSHYFLSLPDRTDPSPAFLAQFRKLATVAPISTAPSRDDFLTGSMNGTSTIFQINKLDRIDSTTFTADAIQASAPMSATAWHYTLTHDHTGWHVAAKQPTGAA